MNMIRPVSDLRNNFADISKTIKEIADNCGVPEQTVRGWCRRNHVAKGSLALSESPKSSI